MSTNQRRVFRSRDLSGPIGCEYHVLDAPLAVLDADDADVDSLLGVSGDGELGELTNKSRVLRVLSNESRALPGTAPPGCPSLCGSCDRGTISA